MTSSFRNAGEEKKRQGELLRHDETIFRWKRNRDRGISGRWSERERQTDRQI